jgi:hypothetical protein
VITTTAAATTHMLDDKYEKSNVEEYVQVLLSLKWRKIITVLSVCGHKFMYTNPCGEFLNCVRTQLLASQEGLCLLS